MNRKILVLLILIGLFAVIGVAAYAYIEGVFEQADTASEITSEVESEAPSEVKSETTSEITKDPNEGVDTEIPISDEVDSESITDGQLEGDPEAEYDENGDLRENSKYLDDDRDTIANYFDICPGVDDFSDDCETTAYDKSDDVESETPVSDDSVANENTNTGDTTTAAYDKNGDLREKSTYLDDDGDTIANFYDICPGVDDFSSECSTDAYDQK